MDAIALSIFANRIDAVSEEMGVTLERTAFSPNIRDRLDYSCAVFDAWGELCAQAAHIPVHLGSMAFTMRDVVTAHDWKPGDMLCLNDPYRGGTHLPDVTMIAPLFIDNVLAGFVANRAHHADIGASSPGSMPLSSSLHEEGIVISPLLLVKAGQILDDTLQGIMARMRNPTESRGDFVAQIAANRRGLKRLDELVCTMGLPSYCNALTALNDYAALLADASLRSIPQGEYRFVDMLDDDGLGNTDIRIEACIRIEGGTIEVDFSGTSEQVQGNVNCPLSVTAAAVYYVFRCLLPPQTPACAGSFRPLHIHAPHGCLLNARYPAAVTAGNVETSTRVVDVVLGALAQAVPHLIPAASHGSMNNLAMGSASAPAWDYYETIGGGMGASGMSDGLDAVQTHMTNTLNTPVESLEMHYPVRVLRYQVRRGSGGAGNHRGGDGILREFEFLRDAQVTLLSERRAHPPWGLNRAHAGKRGKNFYNDEPLKSKVSLCVMAGDTVRIETPGGGGFGVSK